MDGREIQRLLLREFPYSPTPGQEELIRLLSDFVVSNEDQFPLFLLEGFAGTGKTTVVSALVRALPETGFHTVLLAPTGRAAKVLAGYSGKPAFTIHRRIYRISMSQAGEVRLALAPNTQRNTIFIVDEASMIPDDRAPGEHGFFQSRNLLEDLLEHVYAGENCKLLLLGDPAQLPPVGIEHSPALDREVLRDIFNLDVRYFILEEVVRQAMDSGILEVATGIRSRIGTGEEVLPLFRKRNGFPDVRSIDGNEMLDALNESYSGSGQDNTVVVTRSNKRANMFNFAIRQRVLFQENEITTGDMLMVVRNNYFWLPEESKAGFIANGDIIRVEQIRKQEELYSFRFMDATIRMVDYPDEAPLDVKLLLDTLGSESPSLGGEENRRLFDEVMADYMDIPSRRKKLENVRKNPHYNALQVKHANALTCHKTQGGQWEVVFIEKGYLTDDMINNEYMRWLYTAVTRATKTLYLVNFDDRFFER